jgi:hypothetical protein
LLNIFWVHDSIDFNSCSLPLPRACATAHPGPRIGSDQNALELHDRITESLMGILELPCQRRLSRLDLVNIEMLTVSPCYIRLFNAIEKRESSLFLISDDDYHDDHQQRHKRRHWGKGLTRANSNQWKPRTILIFCKTEIGTDESDRSDAIPS